LSLAYGEFAVSNAIGQTLGNGDRALFAKTRDKFAEGGAKRGLGEGVDGDAIKNGLGESFTDVGQRCAAGVGRAEFFEG
jgi:hypothetical protein